MHESQTCCRNPKKRGAGREGKAVWDTPTLLPVLQRDHAALTPITRASSL